MDCKKTKILLMPYVLGDLVDDSKESIELHHHLSVCRTCAEEYKSIKLGIEFIEQYKVEFAEAFDTFEAEEQEELKRSWQCIEARLAKIEAQEKRERQIKWHSIRELAAVAACIVICIFFWLISSTHRSDDITVSQQLTSTSKAAVRIEQLSDNGGGTNKTDCKLNNHNKENKIEHY